MTAARTDESLPAGPAGALVGATVATLDPRRPRATAVAWRDGVITAVGDDAEIRAAAGAGAEIIDGRGWWVCPGLVDSHIHPFWGTVKTRGVDLRSAATLSQLQARLADARAGTATGRWLLAHSARYEPFAAGGITADAITEATGGCPTLISFFDGHTALANHEALARAGVTGARHFQEAAEIACDPDGRPTGALFEAAAMAVVQQVVPAWSEGELLDAYAATLRKLNTVGLTGAHVMLGSPELLDACRALERRGALTVRLLMPMHQQPHITDDEVSLRLTLIGSHGRRWRTGTAKFFLDGVLESNTAWLVDPGRVGTNRANAVPFWPDLDRYRELVVRFAQAGFSVSTHAVGDGAVRGALDAYGAAAPPRRGMHRIEHIETLTDVDLPRFAQLNVAASMQPLHMEGLDDPNVPHPWTEGLSAGRYERAFRCADLVAAGVPLALGSDWMVADFDPRIGMAWAQLRRRPGRPDLTPVNPGQAVGAEVALRGYTTAPARIAGATHEYGHIAPGLRADLTALGADLLSTPPDEQPHVPVRATIVDGEVVHRA